MAEDVAEDAAKASGGPRRQDDVEGIVEFGVHVLGVGDRASRWCATSRERRVAALEAFREQGPGVPLEDVAERAGVSPRTLDNRFATREALIDAVAPELVGECLQVIVDQADAADGAWAGRKSWRSATAPGGGGPRASARAEGVARQDLSVEDLAATNAFVLRACEDPEDGSWRRQLRRVLTGTRAR